MDVFLSLGSNLGDRLAHVCRAVQRIRGLGQVTGLSALYRTDPILYSQQPDFLNCAVRLRTTLAPHELLHSTQTIEREIGRTKSDIPKGPREIDIDISLYGELRLNSPELVLPHPGVTQRDFVLRTLLDIDSSLTLDGHSLQVSSTQDFLPMALQSNPRRVLPAKKRFLELGPGPLLWAFSTDSYYEAAVLELEDLNSLPAVKADTLVCISVKNVQQAEAALLAGADIIRDETGGDCAELCREVPYVCVNPQGSVQLNFNALVECASAASLHPSVVTVLPGLPASAVQDLLFRADFARTTEVERTQQLLARP